MSKGRLPLPKLIIAAATIYDKLHVEPARRFIEQQRALFKQVDNDLYRLSICSSCLHYYDPENGIICAGSYCDRVVSCGDEQCSGMVADRCNGCGVMFCNRDYPYGCMTACQIVGCEQRNLCRNCCHECCDGVYCHDHRVKCVVCTTIVCEECSAVCAICGAGPWCLASVSSSNLHDGVVAVLNDEHYCVDCLQRCNVCDKLSLEVFTCLVCNYDVCEKHNSGACDLCGSQLCTECVITCSECQGGVCPNCCNGTICQSCPDEEEDGREDKRRKK